MWRGEGWPQSWKEGVIISIVKKGEGGKVGEYRGVTLMPTLYKVYTMVLANRLEKEVEEKRIVPPNQTGFRKGMGTIDNIYVLNYIVSRYIAKEKGKLVALFVDFKAAFDSVDRGDTERDDERERGKGRTQGKGRGNIQRDKKQSKECGREGGRILDGKGE